MRKILTAGVLIATLGLSASCAEATDWGALGQSIFNKTLNSQGTQSRSPSLSGLPSGDVAAAFKEALSIGSTNVVSQLGATNGFLNDPKVHIPLPSQLGRVQSALRAAGMSHMLDDLETRLNRAAEIATPHAKELFLNAISEMSFDDVMAIYNGPQNSATQFFQSKMSASLGQKMTPYVNNALSEAGAVQAYDRVMGQYQKLPFMPDVKANLSSYVVDEGVEGIFYYLGQQEAAIRQDPVKQVTPLLKKVFGQR
ncbi:DUF4197 domain-containing protein [Alphaproteobacteria bacterium]|nr:DUF4197 domain-containing protein [Alphaproteobacteria bacterium]